MKTLSLALLLAAALASPASAAIVAAGPSTAGTFSSQGAPLAFFPSAGGAVAAGDVDGDGVADLVLGGGRQVVVRDGRTHAVERTFPGGLYVATGDVTGDGRDEILVSAGATIRVYDGAALIRSFSAAGPIAAGDVNRDGFDDIVVVAGAGGGPHVKAFSGRDGSLLRAFSAGDVPLSSLAAGDLDGDGRAEILTGAGGVVRVHDAAGLRNAFFAGTTTAALAAARGTILVGGGSQVRAFDASTLALKSAFSPFPTVTGVAIQGRI